MSPRPRLHYLDNLRASVIILVIVLHAAITCMADPPTWWYVIDADRSVVFTWLVLLAVATLAGSLAVSALVLERFPGCGGCSERNGPEARRGPRCSSGRRDSNP